MRLPYTLYILAYIHTIWVSPCTFIVLFASAKAQTNCACGMNHSRLLINKANIVCKLIMHTTTHTKRMIATTICKQTITYASMHAQYRCLKTGYWHITAIPRTDVSAYTQQTNQNNNKNQQQKQQQKQTNTKHSKNVTSKTIDVVTTTKL